MSALTSGQNCWTSKNYLASDIPTMAHAPGAGGYRPLLVGRMRSGSRPADARPETTARTGSGSLAATWGISPGPTIPTASAPRALRAIQSLSPSGSGPCCRTPYVARAQDYQRFERRVPAPAIQAPERKAEHPWIAWWRDNRAIRDISEEEARRARTAHCALWGGRVLTRLAALGLADNTLIVYNSAHRD